MSNGTKETYNLICVLGPTAVGKTRFAALLSARLNGEIISADSRQVYRGMDIATGKDYDDYIVDGKVVPVHLVDIADPGYEYNVYEYQNDFISTFNEITSRKKMPVLCGGSGLYLEAVLKGYKLIQVPVDRDRRKQFEQMSDEELADLLASFKELHNISDTSSRKRLVRAVEIAEYYQANPSKSSGYPDLTPLVIGLSADRDLRRQRITERLKFRLENGMIDEAKKLIEQGLSYEKMIYYGLEYKYLAFYLKGDISYDEMFTQLNTAIHRFAKRQMTWFRRMEREGINIKWIDSGSPDDEKLILALNLLKS